MGGTLEDGRVNGKVIYWRARSGDLQSPIGWIGKGRPGDISKEPTAGNPFVFPSAGRRGRRPPRCSRRFGGGVRRGTIWGGDLPVPVRMERRKQFHGVSFGIFMNSDPANHPKGDCKSPLLESASFGAFRTRTGRVYARKPKEHRFELSSAVCGSESPPQASKPEACATSPGASPGTDHRRPAGSDG